MPPINQRSVADLANDEGFKNISPEAQQIVINIVGRNDANFLGLSEDAQQLVRDRLTARRGPVGIFTPKFRQSRKEKVEAMNPVERFITRAGPPALATGAGFALGAATGPFAPVASPLLGSLFGAGAELLTQDIGVTPESKAAVIGAGAAPLLGPAAGIAGRATGQVVRAGSRQIAPIRAAIARKTLGEAGQETEKLGTKILGSQKALLKVPQGEIKQMVNRIGATLDPSDLSRTRAGLESLTDEITRRGLGETEAGRDALNLLKSVKTGLFPTPPVARIPGANKTVTLPKSFTNAPELAEFPTPDPSTIFGARALAAPPPGQAQAVSFDRYLALRSEVGQAVKNLESKAGVRLGSAKRLFGNMAEDLKTVATKATGNKRKAAVLSGRFLERSKLEFAVQDLESIIAQSSKALRGEGDEVVINTKAVVDRLNAMTNPKNLEQFDSNFTDALKSQMPQIKEMFTRLNELAGTSAAGRGSLVIRGRFAKFGAAVGGTIGGVFGGLPGAGIGAASGAAIGSGIPEVIVAGLLHPRGRRFLEFTIRKGRGTIDAKSWAVYGALVEQLAAESGRSIKGLADQALSFADKQAQRFGLKQP